VALSSRSHRPYWVVALPDDRVWALIALVRLMVWFTHLLTVSFFALHLWQQTDAPGKNYSSASALVPGRSVPLNSSQEPKLS
jgi:hypothetical protein